MIDRRTALSLSIVFACSAFAACSDSPTAPFTAEPPVSDTLASVVTAKAKSPPDAKPDVAAARIDALRDALDRVQPTLRSDERSIALGIGLRQAIDALVIAGLADAALVEAHDLMTRLLVALRLVAPDCSEPPPASQALVARACGCGSWPELLTAVDCARASVQTAWQHLFGASAPATSA